jgi:ABC-2 type transport system permease protein
MNSQALIRVIASREFMARMKSRVFAITTALTVIGIAGYILLQAYVFNKSTSALDVGFVGAAQSIAAPVRAEAASLDETINVHSYPSTAAGRADVQSKVLDALVSGPPTATTVTVDSSLDPALETVLNDSVRESVLNDMLTQHGIDPTSIDNAIASASVHVDELSPVNAVRVQQIVIGLLVALTLYVTLIIYGQLVAAGVIEEKSNRIVEILLATVRPWQLMMGKIIGIGLVALIQVAITAGVALVVASATKLVSIPTLGVDVVISGIVWFVLGYLMYALLFAGAGSMVSRQEDVGSVTMPVIFVLVAAWILALTVALPDPGSTGTTVLSFIPLFAPVIMPIRIAAEVVPFWQVAVSVLLVLGTIGLFTIVAGRIYRNSVLHIGGRVKFGQALGLPAIERGDAPNSTA